MDIKAVQAEASTRATAWLTQNLPVEGQSSAPQQGEQKPPAIPPQAQTPPVEQPKVETPPPAIVPAKPGMAEAIRRDREQRAAANVAQGEATKYKSELETLRKENAALKAAGGTGDPFEFLKTRKLTKEQQAQWGQAFLYDLKPEVAPPEFRLEIYKAEQARQKEAELAEAEERQLQESRQAERAQLDRYANEIYLYVQSSPGSNPESEMWFTEDGPDGQPQVNHRVYAQSLLATANNLVQRAQATGQQADLSPANIAKVLEAEVSKRLQRRDAKRASKAPTEQKAPSPGPNGAPAMDTSTTASAEGLRGGPPLPPDTSDEARRARAAAVLFGTK